MFTQREMMELSSKGITKDTSEEAVNKTVTWVRNSILKNDAVMSGEPVRIVGTVTTTENGKRVDIDIDETLSPSEIHDLISEHFIIGAVAKSLESRKKKATLLLKVLMEQFGHVWPKEPQFGHRFCTVSESKESAGEYFDVASFAADHPELYAEYLRKKEPSRNLYVK